MQCHLCGRWFKALGTHLYKKHEITADDYREKFGLRYTTALVSECTHDRLSISTKASMDLDRLAAIRALGAETIAERGLIGKKRRLESKIDPRYIEAQRKAIMALREGLATAREEGIFPAPKTDQLQTEEARKKAAVTRRAKAAQTNQNISDGLKRHFAKYGAPKKPPITEETRERMRAAAKRRGITPETFAKIRAANKLRCAAMTLEQRRAMFKGRPADEK